MNIPYLIHAIDPKKKTMKLSDLTATIDAAPLDMNLAIWGAIDRGEIEVDEDKDKVTALVAWDLWYNPDLASKLIQVVQHYAANETNITKGRLHSYIKEPVSGAGYPLHEYLMTLQYLIDTAHVVEQIVTVPKVKNRPYRRYVFLCLPENDKVNEEWNAKAVNKWIADWESNKVK